MPPLTAWMKRQLDAVEQTLVGSLPEGELPPTRLHAGMRHAVLGGGKRVRALLCLATTEALAGNAAAALKAGCAVELMHAYSLVHDDMPSMDNDVLRRGKPTVHVAFGEATALLVGDGLQALAFELLSSITHEGVASTQALVAVHTLARAVGPVGMVGGQAIDLAIAGSARPEDLPCSFETLQAMHRMKTGALLQAAVEMGLCCVPDAIVREASTPYLRQFAAAIGLAFQIVDDVLDVVADSATLGKTTGKDQAMAKPTYVSLLGLSEARGRALALHREALQSLEVLASLQPLYSRGQPPSPALRSSSRQPSPAALPATPLPPALRPLAQLADLIVHRES
jgi:farnesyl diphosphate synthase